MDVILVHMWYRLSTVDPWGGGMTFCGNGNSDKRSLQVVLARQRYNKLKQWWRRLTRIDIDKPELGSWLEAAPRHHRPWGVGCRVCRETAQKNTGQKGSVSYRWANFDVRGANLTTQNIRRHMLRKNHLAAIACLIGGKTHVLGSPPLVEFQKILQDSQKGLSHSSSKDIADRHKVSQMRWCLAEAIKDIERSSMKRAIAVALHQDARSQLFLVRYAAVMKDMRVVRGVLGTAKNFGTTSDDICQATINICKSFCTPRLLPPRTANRPSTMDLELFEHLRSIVEVVDADAAADEQRALRILQGSAKSMTLACHKFFPNLKVILRDRTHAATRRQTQNNVVQNVVVHSLSGRTMHTLAHVHVMCYPHCLSVCPG